MGIKTKTFLFLGISLFFILGVFGVSHADCSTGNYDYNSCYYNGNYNYSGCSGTSCYNPANYEGACATCSQNYNYNTNYNYSSNYCDNFGPNYCYGGNVYHQRNCYRTDNTGVRTNYADSQVVQYCVGGQTCQNGICATQQQNYCDSFGAAYCVGNAVYQQRTCHGADISGNSSYSDVRLLQTCAVGQTCQSGVCVGSSAPTYFLHYRKTCFSGNLFWLDSNSTRQDQSQNCTDANECTVDSCSASRCVNKLKCDGSICAVNSESYCANCKHCGDGVCGCGETSDTCLVDCKTLNGLPFSIFENTNSNSQWLKNASIKAGEKVNFLAVVSNNEKDAVNNVVVKMNVPNELSIGSIKIDGNALSGDIRSGINIGTLVSKEARAITFTADAPASLSQNTANVAGTITADNISVPSTDSVQLAFTDSSSNIAVQPKTGAGTGLTASLSGMFRSKYFLPILIAIIVGLFIIRMIYLSFFRK